MGHSHPPPCADGARPDQDDVEYVFDDSIASLTETATGVDVTFERGAPRTFDLVVGADGLHSNVRRLAFGPESRFVHSTGYHVASVPGDLGLDGRGRLYNEPTRGITVSTPHAGEAATVMFVFSADGLAYDRHDVEGAETRRRSP
jgi:2-polyprenyl-6-methoxyphenol hydroxylase-like FAD-dependent oxidoreductase